MNLCMLTITQYSSYQKKQKQNKPVDPDGGHGPCDHDLQYFPAVHDCILYSTSDEEGKI